MLPPLAVALLLALTSPQREATAPRSLPLPDSLLATDRDGDGLPDLWEEHKYGTDPAQADTDGDGIPDGDWYERREYSYSLRAVVQVLPPVTLERLNDERQDVRLLDRADDYVELEVVLYPYSKVHDAEGAGLSMSPEERSYWTAPGPTADWDASMARELEAELLADGIELEALGPAAFVRRAAAWLLDNAQYEASSGSALWPWNLAFDERGRPKAPEWWPARIEASEVSEAFHRTSSARGMYLRRRRGSCTPTSIYLAGGLRAVGIPTRTVLAIPLYDRTDPGQVETLTSGVLHAPTREAILDALPPNPGADEWASHTINEVWFAGRWHLLDGAILDPDPLYSHGFGPLIRVATLHDWADGRAWETVGRRQDLGLREHPLSGSNPYRLVSIRESAWPNLPTPPDVERPLAVAPSTVGELRASTVEWTDSSSLRSDILRALGPQGRFGILIRYTGLANHTEYPRAVRARGDRISLTPVTGDAKLAGIELAGRVDFGCTWTSTSRFLAYVPLDRGQVDRLPAGSTWQVWIEPKDGPPASQPAFVLTR